jgi:hypothetical protein
VLRVNNTSEVNLETLKNKIFKLNNQSHMSTPKWKDEKLNVLIPMAGAGSRFEKAGYTFPKPLIEVNGVPMIQVVVNNLNIELNNVKAGIYLYTVEAGDFKVTRKMIVE